jgi:hypothetical protein
MVGPVGWPHLVEDRVRVAAMMLKESTSFPLSVLAGRAIQQAVVKPKDIKNHNESVPAHCSIRFIYCSFIFNTF